MPATFIIISICFTVFAVVLGWIIVTGGEFKLPAIARAMLVAWLIVMSVALAFSFKSMLGYPAYSSLPDQLNLISATINEPTKTAAGAIYIWGHPETQPKAWWKLFVYDTRKLEPRAYVMPYSTDAHQKMEDALKQLKDGKKVTMRRQVKEKIIAEAEGPEAEGGSKNAGARGTKNPQLPKNSSGTARSKGANEEWSQSFVIENPSNTTIQKDDE